MVRDWKIFFCSQVQVQMCSTVGLHKANYSLNQHRSCTDVFNESSSLQFPENSRAEEGEGELGAELRAGRGMPHQRPVQEA